MARHWILTCNPKRWDFFGFLAGGKTVQDIKGWSVAARFEETERDDDVALWITGSQRGVYALGVIDGPPTLDFGDEYWIDPTDQGRQRRFLPIRLTRDLTTRPILAPRLQADPRFARASVLTFPRGANPHPLDDVQWQAIVDRV